MLLPAGRDRRSARCARSRATRGHPDAREDGLDRHLLHRRAAVPRVPRALPAAHAGADRDARRARGRPAPGARVLHARPAAGPRHRRHARRDGRAVVRRGKDAARNALVVVQGHDHPRLLRDARRRASSLHWIAGRARRRCRRTPRRQDALPDAGCRVRRRARATTACRADFDAPQWAPTPGQYLVLYDGDVCLGGGVIAVPPQRRRHGDAKTRRALHRSTGASPDAVAHPRAIA